MFFVHGPSTTDIYPYCPTLSLHDALPIFGGRNALVIADVAGHERPGRFALALQDLPGYRLAVDRDRQRLPHLHIVERRPFGVEEEIIKPLVRADLNLVAEILAKELGQIGRASCRERVCRTCRSRWAPDN